MTRNYLDLIATYVSLIILLSKVDDRKTVLGLYTIAHELVNGQGDPSFPRLGQMIVDYEVPMKKLAEDFVPHSKVKKLEKIHVNCEELLNNFTCILSSWSTKRCNRCQSFISRRTPPPMSWGETCCSIYPRPRI